MRRIAVFAGAFDPIHQGHVSVIKAVLSKGKADEVILVPAGSSPYRKALISPQSLRELCEAAISGLPGVRLLREEPLESSRSVLDAIKNIREQAGKAEYLYIAAADKLAGILLWPEASELIRLCRLLVYLRPGDRAEKIALAISRHRLDAEILDMPPVEAESARIYAQLKELSDARGMLAPEIARLIALHGLYQPPYAELIKPRMSRRRFIHTLRVRDLAVELAYEHHLPMQAAAVAALLHDCAKEMKLSMMQAVARSHSAGISAQVMGSNALLHGRVAAILAEHKYGVRDVDVLNAIRYHTTGRPGMSALELCLFVADKAERGRAPYPGLEEIRRLMHEDLDAAALVSMQGTKEYLAAMGKSLHPEAKAAIDYLKQRKTSDQKQGGQECRGQN